jgi:hypothetical protein
MKNSYKLSTTILLIVFVSLAQSCTKEKHVAPTLTTKLISNISYTTVLSGGVVTNEGGTAVVSRGVCWNTSPKPTINNDITIDGSGLGVYQSSIDNLTPNTKYYVRAYALNNSGTGYGNEISFTTSQIAIPVLTTTAITSITQTTAVTGGNITDENGGPVIQKGVCWSTTTNPTISDNKTSDGTGSGLYTSTLAGLTANMMYYVRAYATNSAGTAYGNEVTFTTGQIVIPTLTTTSINSITLTTASSGGKVLSNGGGTISGRGVCWSTSTNPTIANSKTIDSPGNGDFVSNLTGLLPGTIYHVRSYATNSAGTGYGNDLQFTTNPVLLATLTTSVVTAINTTSALSGGNITSDGGGEITSRGVCWSTSTLPTTSDSKTSNATGSGNYTSMITSLMPGTTFHIRAYAVNMAGTSYGNEVTFTSIPVAVPTITTTSITSIDITSSVSGGNIDVTGAGVITAKGICWSTSPTPTIGDSHTSDGTGTGVFLSNLSSLVSGTVYYVRSYATNIIGTGYGNQVFFSTKLADLEGNKYSTMLIGTQLWTAENLKSTKYNNNTFIPLVGAKTDWSARHRVVIAGIIMMRQLTNLHMEHCITGTL